MERFLGCWIFLLIVISFIIVNNILIAFFQARLNPSQRPPRPRLISVHWMSLFLGIILHKILYSVKGCTVPFALGPYLITRGTPGPLELFRDSSTCDIFVESHSGVAKLAVGGVEMILCRLSSGSHSATLLGSTFKLVVVVEMLLQTGWSFNCSPVLHLTQMHGVDEWAVFRWVDIICCQEW